MQTLLIRARGKFAVRDHRANEMTPAGQKEKALVALLAFSPGHRRTRRWIQNVLWSDRFPEQASASLRRAIYNLRKQDGIDRSIVDGDRTEVWLKNAIELDLGHCGQSELLEDINVSDPAFQDWLRELRYKRDGKVQRANSPNIVRSSSDIIKIVCLVDRSNYEANFLSRFFVDLLATRLRTHGDIEVEFSETVPEASRKPETSILTFEIESMLTENEWFLRVRIINPQTRRFLWSGRMRSSKDLQEICDGPQISSFIGRVLTAMLAKSSLEERSIPYFAIQCAAEKIFLGNRSDLEFADRILDGLGSSDRIGIARAWRSYIGLTRALEYGERSDDSVGESMELATSALRMSRENALVAALASQIFMKLSGDIERGTYFAMKSLEYCSHNPYAMHSLSQAKIFARHYEAGHHLALLGKEASQSLTNSYCWDLQCCLTAMGMGRIDEALEHAATAHLKMKNYRPAIRYLLALNLIKGNVAEAATFAGRLRHIEPGFDLEHLSDKDYPLETLRLLGLDGQLASAVSVL